jgi:hypothetical protein
MDAAIQFNKLFRGNLNNYRYRHHFKRARNNAKIFFYLDRTKYYFIYASEILP